MREFLITKFVCCQCGSNLQLTYDLPKGPSKHSEGEPTGAYMVEQLVGIQPCKCVTAPLQKMKESVRVLLQQCIHYE